jgi:hypothetical protein
VVVVQNRCAWTSTHELAIQITLRPGPKIGCYDVDNFNKGIFDSLENSRVFINDEQVRTLVVEKGERCEKLEHGIGQAIVTIMEIREGPIFWENRYHDLMAARGWTSPSESPACFTAHQECEEIIKKEKEITPLDELLDALGAEGESENQA